jgi:trimethylamine--corrinoid protein Co-methyltransferase
MKELISKVEVLSQDEIFKIHKAALAILARTGMGLPNKECLARCEKAGAVVDYEKEIIKLPVSVMENLLTEFGFMKNKPMPSGLTVRVPVKGLISTQVFVVDYETRQRRYGTSDDILKGIRLIQHLDNIFNCSAVCVPSDIDSRVTDLYSYLQIYKYSEKAGGTYILSPQTASYIMDMAECMDRKEWYLFETVTPLRFRKESLEMAILFADRGHNLSIAPMVVGGSTGPVTMAGVITLATAEVLGSMFVCYALAGNFPAFFYGHGSHSSDPSSMLCSFGSPNQALIGIASAQMGDFYGMVAGSNSALTDALQPDFQCGYEKASNAIFSCLAGTIGIGCQGIVGADQGFSFEQLVIDNEWLDAYRYVISGFEVNEETIAEELIHTIGIGGNFVAEEHTAKHLRENWWPSKLFVRNDWDIAHRKYTDKSDLLSRAHLIVEELTAGYKNMEPVLPENKVKALEDIATAGMKAILSKT